MYSQYTYIVANIIFVWANFRNRKTSVHLTKFSFLFLCKYK